MVKGRCFYGFYLLQAASLVAVLFPFFRWNNLLEWDFPGHYSAIWYLKTYLLPWPTGWNPFFYCGYPQGLFYPPLAHYLAALLSFALGIGLAMKILIATSLLLLPLSFFAFARRCGLDEVQASVCGTWMMAILFLSGDMFRTWTFGSDLRSILNVGLFANALSLPILFAFLASYGTGLGHKSWKSPALLLGTLFLLHPLSSLIAVLFILAFLLGQLGQPAQQIPGWKPVLLTLGTALLLGAFWILPFVTHRSYMNTESLGADWTPPVQFVILNGLILALACFSKTQLRPLLMTYIVLCNFILVGTMWKLDLHFTRLTIYLLFFIPVFLLIWVRSQVILTSLVCFAIGVGTYGYHHSGIQPAGVPDFPLPNFGPVRGRILSVAPPSHLPGPHVHHELIPLRTGNLSQLGLFIESSLNGRFLGDLTRTLDPHAYVWGTPTGPTTPQEIGDEYPSYVRDRLRLFDVRYVYTDLKLEDTLDPALASSKRYVNSYPAPKLATAEEAENLQRRYNTHGDLVDFYLYPLESGALAEPLPYVPKVPGSDWKLTNVRWFLRMRGVPIFTDRAVPVGVREARQGERVDILETSPRMDHLALQIHASQDIPVLVKVGFSPNWKLSLNGVKAAVHRASPDLILIFGHGRAVLDYKRPWEEYAGLGLTFLGLALLIFLK